MRASSLVWWLWVVAAVMVASTACSNSNAAPGGPGGGKRVFVTRALFPGSMGGLVGGDAQCESFAAAAGMAGTWKAWLSDSATDALERIADVGPWLDVHGARVFRDKAQLMGFPDVNLNVDETGGAATGVYWTGTMLGGGKSPNNCADWTDGATAQATFGDTSSADRWTDTGPLRLCSESLRLLCFEQ
jgi:hypothetical protein